MKKAVLFLLVISVATIYSQEYVNLFKKDLTDRIRFEAFPKQLVNKDLDMVVKIHPELLYYYITYFNLKYDGKVEAEYRLYDKELGEARSKYIKERNNWFYCGTEHLKAIEKDTNQLAGELKYFLKNNPYKDLTIAQVCDSCYKTDKNRLDYIVYKYYLQDRDLTYLPNEDYAELRKEHEEQVKKQLDEGYNDLISGNISKGGAEDDYTMLINFWYLFPEKNDKVSLQAWYTKLIINKFYKNVKIVVDEAKEKADAEVVRAKFRHIIGLVLNYSNFLLNSFTYKYPSGLFDAENSFDIPTHQIYGGVNFAIRLMDRDIIFSKIILELGGGVNLKEHNLRLYSPEYISRLSDSGGKEGFISIVGLESENDKIAVNRIYNISFKVKTPLLFLGKNLSLGAGIVANFISAYYTPEYGCYIVENRRGLDIHGHEYSYEILREWVAKYEVEYSSSFTRIYPVLTAEYNFPLGLTIGCEASFNFFTVGISI